MSALALVAQGMGYRVTGSDTAEEFITDGPLREAGIVVDIDFRPEHLRPGVDLVVVGAAYGKDNLEVAAAHIANLPVWTYSELLGYLSGQKQTLAVAGTHGKTTTTSILSFLLYRAGWSPSFVIGTGHVAGLPAHGQAGDGKYFITEADDYKRAPEDPRPKFLDLNPVGAVITSIEHDHPDLYPQLADCVRAFEEFAARLQPSGFLVVNGDDPEIQKLIKRLSDHRVIQYGFNEGLDYQIQLQPVTDTLFASFSLLYQGKPIGPFRLSLAGRHNLYNAAAAIVVALTVGLEPEAIGQYLPLFTTVERRFQLVGRVGQLTIIDDYAHHPSSVRLTLEAAKSRYPNQPIWCIFQSHTYSRTKALLADFGKAFAAADEVIITDIFASAREKEVTVSPLELVSEIAKHQPKVRYLAKDKLLSFLKQELPSSGVLITMGAGDIYQIGRQLVAEAVKENTNDR